MRSLPTLSAMRRTLHRAQHELAPICRDELYSTDQLRELLYQLLPELYAELERDALTAGAKAGPTWFE